MIKLTPEQVAQIKSMEWPYPYAGHLPTRVFTQSEWLAMPIIIEELSQDYAPLNSPGPYRTTLRSRPIVFYCNHITNEYWQVQPIVRVPAGREQWRFCPHYHDRICDDTCDQICNYSPAIGMNKDGTLIYRTG